MTAALPRLGSAVETHDISYAYSENLPALLTERRLTLLISTYQAGNLVAVSADEGKLVVSFHLFERAMGVAVRTDALAVATRNQIWLLRNAPDLVGRLNPPGRRDGCFLARLAHFTGDMFCHEIAWAANDLWMVNTLFSCLCTTQPAHSFAPRWRPPFITALAPEDRCHLNGLAVAGDRPCYVTALSETDVHQGWRPVKATGGCLIDVASGQTVVRGLALPHSPRVADDGQVYLLHSGRGRLDVVDPKAGRVEPVIELAGYTRGLALHGSLAFVGLSKIRSTSNLGGVPIEERRDQLRCGVAVVDRLAGRVIAFFHFTSGIEELFDVQVMGLALPFISGPADPPFWTIPPGSA